MKRCCWLASWLSRAAWTIGIGEDEIKEKIMGDFFLRRKPLWGGQIISYKLISSPTGQVKTSMLAKVLVNIIIITYGKLVIL